MVGTSIGAAEAISTQLKPPAAPAAAKAAEAFKKSRRLKSFMSFSLRARARRQEPRPQVATDNDPPATPYDRHRLIEQVCFRTARIATKFVESFAGATQRNAGLRSRIS